jgi:Polysulphide reductase, NrfD
VSDIPVIKEPVWKPEIPFYFYTGGLAGGSAGLAALSELRGNHVLARRAWAAALAGGVASPALLVSDLGVSHRFHHMLRMFKVTSPMSVGSWMLSAFVPVVAAGALDAWNDAVPAGRAARAAAAVLGLPLSTYTAALIADTAVPAWHEARATLPAVFASGAAASAGAAALAVTPLEHAAPARRLAIAGAAAELACVTLMERRLDPLVARPYHEGAAGRLGRVAKLATAAGALAAARRARTGAALITTGAILTRWSVFRAGFQSAADPRATVVPQRARVG